MLHVFVGSKASWHDITDGLPQFEELPDDHNTLSYVSSQTDSLIGTIAFTGILVMAAVLGLAGRSTN